MYENLHDKRDKLIKINGYFFDTVENTDFLGELISLHMSSCTSKRLEESSGKNTTPFKKDEIISILFNMVKVAAKHKISIRNYNV
jgi:hypothetical protein